ncbi:hypothetical protein AVEN_145665-1 [Araneus ventricosus]|uniref:Uncharacterized protein n=1 Tax=Araneus ventricosus TaxID=182803 RepID=A0A4Y2KZ76_ARAVE|nr:hypothetical protein AVEN_145665-1 [Araneus ventricosus]
MIPCDVTACRKKLYKDSAWMTEVVVDRFGERTSLEFYPLCEIPIHLGKSFSTTPRHVNPSTTSHTDPRPLTSLISYVNYASQLFPSHTRGRQCNWSDGYWDRLDIQSSSPPDKMRWSSGKVSGPGRSRFETRSTEDQSCVGPVAR